MTECNVQEEVFVDPMDICHCQKDEIELAEQKEKLKNFFSCI